MGPQITYEDKIAPTFTEEHWSINNQYDKLTVVTDEVTGDSYISKIDVPEGVELTNKVYWLQFGNGKSGDFNKLKLRGYLIQTPDGDYVRYNNKEYNLFSKSPNLCKEDFLYKLNDNYTLTNINTNSIFSVKWSTGDSWFFVSVYNVPKKGLVFMYENPNTPGTIRSIVQAVVDSGQLIKGNIYPVNTNRNSLLDYSLNPTNPYFKLIPVFEPEIRELTIS